MPPKIIREAWLAIRALSSRPVSLSLTQAISREVITLAITGGEIIPRKHNQIILVDLDLPTLIRRNKAPNNPEALDLERRETICVFTRSIKRVVD